MAQSRALLSLLFSLSSFAQVEFRQNVDRERVGTEDTFELTIVVGNAPDDAELKIPESKDFVVLSRSSGTQMQFQMGGGGSQFRKQTTHTLVMQAQKPGTLLIPPAVLKTRDRTFQTEAIRMEVKEGQTSPRKNGRAQGGAFPPLGNMPDIDDFFGGFGQPRDVPQALNDGDVRLVTQLDRTEAWVGEQVTLSTYILSRAPLASVDALSQPKLDGFWSEDIESPTQLVEQEREVDGVRFRYYLVKRRALFPTSARDVVIAPTEADIVLRLGFSNRKIHRTSEELVLKVKPLPPGAPDAFSTQNVGEWKAGLELSATHLTLGEPVTARLWFEGVGNVKNLELPALQVPGGIKQFPPSQKETVKIERGLLGGRLVQEHLLIPQQPGTYTFPQVPFPFFNPATGRYETVTARSATLVVQAAGTPSVSSTGPAQAKILRPLRVRMSAPPPEGTFWQQPRFWVLSGVPVALWLGSLGLAWFLKAGRAGGLGPPRRKSSVRAQLEPARKALPRKDLFFGELEKALVTACQHRLAEPVSGMTLETLADRLLEAGVPPALVERVRHLQRRCQEGRFAPMAQSLSFDELLSEAEDLLQELES